MELSKLHLQRWTAARVLFIEMVAAATRLGKDAVFLFDGCPIGAEDIRITEDSIYVSGDNCVFGIFEADPELDAGLHTTIPKFEKDIRASFILAKKVKW